MELCGSYVGEGCSKRFVSGLMSGMGVPSEFMWVVCRGVSSELMWVLCRGVPSGIMWVLCWGGVFQAVCVGSYVGDGCAKRIYVGRLSGGVKRIDVGLMLGGAKWNYVGPMLGRGVPSGLCRVLCRGCVCQVELCGSYVGEGCSKRFVSGLMSGMGVPSEFMWVVCRWVSSELMWVLCRGVPIGLMWVLCQGGVCHAVCVGSYVRDGCAKRIYVGRMSGGVKRIDVGLMSGGAKWNYVGPMLGRGVPSGLCRVLCRGWVCQANLCGLYVGGCQAN